MFQKKSFLEKAYVYMQYYKKKRIICFFVMKKHGLLTSYDFVSGLLRTIIVVKLCYAKCIHRSFWSSTISYESSSVLRCFTRGLCWLILRLGSDFMLSFNYMKIEDFFFFFNDIDSCKICFIKLFYFQQICKTWQRRQNVLWTLTSMEGEMFFYLYTHVISYMYHPINPHWQGIFSI